PFQADRRLARKILPKGQFIEVFVDAPLDVCRERDPKGLYAKADRGEIKQFTGIDSPYEIPEKPEVHIHAEQLSVAQAVNQLLAYLHETEVLHAGYEPIAIEA
ncbi:MAG: adenylyl-sulfate kinase, partial [Candidatus Thiodiazotropha sp. (ex Lucinoma borealis)]|nr:adenylyl-sulfate kinase [Candidatus Thiodiazotropha sp. (ex Lucinoma borealis)]